jgi:outer membrane cobalamin receptor
MKNTTIISLFFVFFTTTCLFAQIKVTGIITDADSKDPLLGAAITIGSKAVVTNDKGEYTLELPQKGSYTVSVSYVGYNTLQQTARFTEGGNTLNLALAESNNLLNTATVTAGKFEKPLGEVTVSMDILRPQLIENVNTKKLDEVLQKIPGVNIIEGQANIRGGSGWSYGAGSRVLLLVDDIPALQADAGFPNWKDVAVENIEQVEVVKGAASALYGSSAMNGIINVRTGFAKSDPETKIATFGTLYLRPKDERKWWWKNGGQPYEAGGSILHKQKFGKLDVAGTLFYYNQEKFEKTNYDKYGRFSLSTRYRITDRLSIGVNTNINAGSGQTYFYFADHLDSAYIGAAGTFVNGKRLRYTIDPYLNYFDKSGNRHKILMRFYNIDNNNSNNQSNSSNLFYSEYQFQRQFVHNLVVTAGIVYGSTAINAPLYGSQIYTSRNVAAYAQADKKIGKLNLSLGLRYENNTLFGPDSVKYNANFTEATQNGGSIQNAKPVLRIGANYQIGKATFLRSSWGQGYRFPTVAEMFINTTAGALRIFPSPQLKAETGWSAEFGVKQGFKLGDWQGFADGSAFVSQYQNMMEFLVAPTPLLLKAGFGFQSQNVGATDIRGVEFSVAGQGKVGEVTPSVLIGYTYIEPTYQNFDLKDTALASVNYNVLKYRFRHNFKFDAELAYKRFTVGAAILYNSHMESVDRILQSDLLVGALGNAGKPFKSIGEFRKIHNKGFTTLDVRVSYKPTDKWKAVFLIANLTNTEYSYRPGILEAPRNVQLRVERSF